MGNDGSLAQHARMFSREQQSSIFSISFLGKRDWSKLTSRGSQAPCGTIEVMPFVFSELVGPSRRFSNFSALPAYDSRTHNVPTQDLAVTNCADIGASLPSHRASA
jgi:hypothetical protein